MPALLDLSKAGYLPHITALAAMVPYVRLTTMLGQSTVLLAEDDPDDVLLTRLAFEKARLANPLQVVRDGVELLAYLQGEGCYSDRRQYPLPFLLLLDLKMPRMHGFQVLEWLRTHPEFQGLSVAIMTSSDHDPDISRAYALGADSYLIKPPDAEALLALVQRLHAYWVILDHPLEPCAA